MFVKKIYTCIYEIFSSTTHSKLVQFDILSVAIKFLQVGLTCPDLKHYFWHKAQHYSDAIYHTFLNKSSFLVYCMQRGRYWKWQVRDENSAGGRRWTEQGMDNIKMERDREGRQGHNAASGDHNTPPSIPRHGPSPRPDNQGEPVWMRRTGESWCLLLFSLQLRRSVSLSAFFF